MDSSGLADNLLISDYHSLMQLTGAKILKEGEYQYPFSREDARLMGEHFWQTILEKGIATYEELRTLLIPSLIAIAQLDPDALREALATETYKEFAISTFIGYQKEGYYKLIENQELLNRLYKAYQEALLQWRRKDALAIKVAQTCIDSHGSSTPFNVIKQNYLEGSTNPCQDIDWFPPKIEARYTKLTKNVSDAYFHFDKKLIEFALNAVDKKDLEYIFSAGVQLYETFADLENEREELVEIPVTAGAPRINAILSVKEKKRTTLNLDKTDLFAAVKGNEQRIYALKQLDGEGGYTLHRVDQDPIVYLKLGLFDHKNIWKGGYQQVGNEILMGNKYFKFSVRVNRSKKLAHGAERNLLIEALGRKHSDKFYDQLYDSGNDKSDVEKLWDVAKHFIPFYDCATGIINQDTEEAVISCTIDTLLMIPVFGQITSLNMKFALGVARAFIRGGIRNVIKKSPTFLPKVAEIRKIVLTLARTIDPGFETIVGGGRLIIKRVVKFKNEFQIARKTKELLERIEVMEKARESLKKNIVMGQLNGLEVPVKGVGADLYMRVTNLETGDVFGGLFMFKGNRLEAHRPAVFTTEQLELLNNLEVKLKEKQAYFVGNNPNPNAYGSGPITTVAQEGEETKHFIRMKGKLIEVTLTTIKEHGIRLDVYARHSGKIIPVNYNGVEWYFEAPTSPFVPKEVEKKITSMLDQFETRKNPSGLSAPDEKGLMWDESGKSYIKVQDHYLSISLSKNKERYHLLKKDNSKSKIVLRFDEKNGKFRFETKLERKKENKSVLTASYHRGKSKGKSDLNKEQSRVSPGESPGTSGTSGNSKGTKNTSQEIGSKTNESGDVLASETFDRFKFGKQTGDVWNNIPPSKEKWDLWNKLRGAEVYKKPPSIRVEDSNVELPPLSKFVSEPTPIFHPNDNEARKSIVAQIKERLPIDFNFRTFAGVKANKMPDFLKPFVEDLEENLVQASDYLDAGITIFTKLSGKAILSETKEGQYLTKLFLLEGLANQEVILRETINRFLSISEKLKKFLRQSKLWEYENILIVSGDLIQQEVGSNKYLSQSTKLLPWGLVVPGDAECRIIIFADAFHINPQLIDPQLIQGCELTQSAYITLIHEITHLVSKTEDIITYPLPGKGLRISVKQQREIINNNFTAILYSEPFNAFVNQLAKELNLPTLSKDVVRQAMYNDRLLLVNFLLTDAEFTTIILRDLIEGRDFDEIIRVTRSTDNLNLEKKFMFLYFAMAFMYSYQGLERTLQLNKEKEKNSTKATDNLSTGIPSKEVPENTEIIVRTEFVEKIKDAEKKSFSDLVTTSIEKSNGTNIATGFVANRPIFAQPIQSRPKRSDLNLTTNTQEIRNNTQFVTNQQGVTEPTQHTANRSISNLINTSTEKSNNLRQTASIKSAERNNSSTLIK
ncbi:hypothetical protein [Candidatus Enterococcus wittei]|uniref:hypothetical protein n=1 Tax=Candidatus Enterococcus wittei TaxID=1987383 RepID=UPI000A33631E|nr:hypothetical protein [Enterococcus sp. 10A9_DIV0425]